MDNVLRDFEDAVRTTYNRHAQNEPSGYFAEETTKTAIAFAVTNNFYSGFTRQNDARSKAMELGKDNIIYALLYNAVSLMDMIHQSGMSLGNVDSYLMSITSYCNNGDFESLKDILEVGFREYSTEQNYILNKKMKDPDKIEGVRKVMAEERINRAVSSQAAYDYVDNLLTGYVTYNAHYQQVSCENEITTWYDLQTADKLTNHYQNLQMTSGRNK